MSPSPAKESWRSSDPTGVVHWPCDCEVFSCCCSVSPQHLSAWYLSVCLFCCVLFETRPLVKQQAEQIKLSCGGFNEARSDSGVSRCQHRTVLYVTALLTQHSVCDDCSLQTGSAQTVINCWASQMCLETAKVHRGQIKCLMIKYLKNRWLHNFLIFLQLWIEGHRNQHSFSLNHAFHREMEKIWKWRFTLSAFVIISFIIGS